MKKWQEMEPRERDAAIARDVMGWKRICRVPEEDWGSDYTGDGLHGQPEIGRFEPVPHYTTDISAAMEVVEEMRQRGYQVVMSIDHAVSGEDWLVSFVPNDGTYDVENESLPAAICEAAYLATKGGE